MVRLRTHEVIETFKCVTNQSRDQVSSTIEGEEDSKPIKDG